MKRKIFITIMACMGILSNAQTGRVGIKTTTPSETLDVNGNTFTNSLYMRNPGEPTKTGGSFLATSQNSLQLYDPTKESSGLFNYIKLTLTGVSNKGITSFDTKIDANKFLVSLHNYSFKLGNGSTAVVLDYGSNSTNDNAQGSPDVVVFKSNGTWHIKALFDNSRLLANNQSYNNPNTNYNDFTVELYLMAYKQIITKQNIPDITIDLGGTNGSTKALAAPSGF